jgi:hypothetical protein
MAYSIPEQLCFPPIAGHTVRADFQCGALSSAFGALLLRGMDRQMGLIARLAAAVQDKRHLSYIAQPLCDLLAQRIYQMASGYPDGHDANSLRHDPLCKLGVARLPLAQDQALASAPTCSRLEHSIDRKDLYRLTQAFVDPFVASYPEPPAALVLALAHPDAPTHGPQELACYHHDYKTYCYLPLFLIAGTSQALVMACRRPGTRPTGAEHAMMPARLLRYLRQQWPVTHLLVRGDSHCATPAVLDAVPQIPRTDVVFGLAANAVLLRQTAPVLPDARQLPQRRTALARAYGASLPTSSRLYEGCSSAAASWAPPWRGVLKAEAMAAGDNPHCVVTSRMAVVYPTAADNYFALKTE